MNILDMPNKRTEDFIGTKVIDGLVVVILLGALYACWILMDDPRDTELILKVIAIILLITFMNCRMNKPRKEPMSTMRDKVTSTVNKATRGVRTAYEDAYSGVSDAFHSIIKASGI